MNRARRVTAFTGRMALALVMSGCASALSAPRDLGSIVPERPDLENVPVDELARRAEVEFAQRTVTSVREAADLWTRIAVRQPTGIEALQSAVRARIWLSETVEDPAGRSREAVDAVRTAQSCDIRSPGSPTCAYWLGAALGVQARENRSTALDALKRMESLFRQAAEEAPLVAAGGPDRALGSLYARAPAWPAGQGDPDRAVNHALRAVTLAPEHPPNYLVAAEALRVAGDRGRAITYLDQGLAVARRRHDAGDPDAPRWIREMET